MHTEARNMDRNISELLLAFQRRKDRESCSTPTARQNAPSASRDRGRFPGVLSHLAKDRPASIEDMKTAVADEAAERFQAATRR